MSSNTEAIGWKFTSMRSPRGERVVIVDDLIATGGTAAAAAALVAIAGGVVVECCFVVDLPDLGGRQRLGDRGIASHALCSFEGE